MPHRPAVRAVPPAGIVSPVKLAKAASLVKLANPASLVKAASPVKLVSPVKAVKAVRPASPVKAANPVKAVRPAKATRAPVRVADAAPVGVPGRMRPLREPPERTMPREKRARLAGSDPRSPSRPARQPMRRTAARGIVTRRRRRTVPGSGAVASVDHPEVVGVLPAARKAPKEATNPSRLARRRRRTPVIPVIPARDAVDRGVGTDADPARAGDRVTTAGPPMSVGIAPRVGAATDDGVRPLARIAANAAEPGEGAGRPPTERGAEVATDGPTDVLTDVPMGDRMRVPDGPTAVDVPMDGAAPRGADVPTDADVPIRVAVAPGVHAGTAARARLLVTPGSRVRRSSPPPPSCCRPNPSRW